MILKTSGKGEQRICPICGARFTPKTLDSKYCSRKCQQAAYRIKKRQEQEQAKLQKQIDEIKDGKKYLTVEQASIAFHVNKTTLYRWIREGKVPATKSGQYGTRVELSKMEELFSGDTTKEQEAVIPQLFDMNPAHCYTIGEICKKFDLDDSTVWAHIRKYSIPTRQVGNYVYAPKSEIDKLYKCL